MTKHSENWMSLDWHKTCAANRAITIASQRQMLQATLNDVERSERQLAEYHAQIERAEREGRDGFDADRYGKARKPKGE